MADCNTSDDGIQSLVQFLQVRTSNRNPVDTQNTTIEISKKPEDKRLAGQSPKINSRLLTLQAEYQNELFTVSRSGYSSFNQYVSASETLNINLDDCRSYSEAENINLLKETIGRSINPAIRYIKWIALIACWVIFAAALTIKTSRSEVMRETSIQPNRIRDITIDDLLGSDRIAVTMKSSLFLNSTFGSKLHSPENYISVWLQVITFDKNSTQKTEKNVTDVWNFPLLPPHFLGMYSTQTRDIVFDIKNITNTISADSMAILHMNSSLNETIPMTVAIDTFPINPEVGIMYGAIILIGLYILIISEVIHRTFAAMIACTLSIAVLAVLEQKPTMAEIISWIDMDTIMLLYAMMILVAIVAETGIFDYLAVYAYKIAGGRIWPLINTLCCFATISAALLDNVTTVLLMTPVTIRLCEVLHLNPVPVLTSMVIYSNIGGAMTPIGDPPNVIIASNRDVQNAGVDFGVYTLHMSIGVLLALGVVHLHFRFIFRDLNVLRFREPQDIRELKQEIAVWQKTLASLSSYSKDENLVRETLMNKVVRLLSLLKNKLLTGSVTDENYKSTLGELQEKYPITNKRLLCISAFVMVFVITFFFLHSLPFVNLTLGWIAMLGVFLLLILADGQDFEGLMARVEWSTLLFFASLFILMEALAKLGLISWIGKQTEHVIMSVSEESRLATAILLILWVSAVAGSFVDNVPLTTVMIRIVTGLAENRDLNLPLQPLVWALALGACLGGNGTLIGATANVVCAGVAEQHGYRFTFMQFFKMGFPVVITSTAAVTVYLMIAHVVFSWNGIVY